MVRHLKKRQTPASRSLLAFRVSLEVLSGLLSGIIDSHEQPKAKAAGKYKGRAPTARAKEAQVAELAAQEVSLSEIARRLGIGKASVHRILKARKEAQKAA